MLCSVGRPRDANYNSDQFCDNRDSSEWRKNVSGRKNFFVLVSKRSKSCKLGAKKLYMKNFQVCTPLILPKQASWTAFRELLDRVGRMKYLCGPKLFCHSFVVDTDECKEYCVPLLSKHKMDKIKDITAFRDFVFLVFWIIFEGTNAAV